MHRHMKTLALGAILFSTVGTESAEAFVHGQLLLGTRRGTFEGGEGLTGDFRTSEVGVSVQFDYLPPEIPVTFGAFLEHKAFRLSETQSLVNRMDVWSAGPEIMTWLPLWDVKPYAKAAIGFGSYMALEAAKTRDESSRAYYSSFSRRYSTGVKWEWKKSFQPLVEYQLLIDELTAEGATPGLIPKDRLIRSGAFFLGFESAL